MGKKGFVMSKHNDLNIKEFEALLAGEKQRVQHNINAVKEEVDSISNEDSIGDDEDMTERQCDNTTDQAILHNLEAELGEIDAALGRIQAGTYGICEKTSKPIPVERLKANPWARTIVSA